MDSRIIIKDIKLLTAQIQEGKDQQTVDQLVQSIARSIANPYLLSLTPLFSVASSHNIDVSSISKRVEELKNEHKPRPTTGTTRSSSAGSASTR